MKSWLTALLLAVSAAAQSISIASPSDGASVTAGSPVTVEVDFPNSLTGVQHVSLVISHIACANQPCNTSAGAMLGNVLYSGNFTPTYSDDVAKPPHQNFTVTFPGDVGTGSNLLNVAHFMLLGASAQPILEFKNITLELQPATTSAQRKRMVRGREFSI